jgi:hypothetical protein
MQKGRFRAQFGMSYVSLHTLPLYPTQRAKVEVPLHNQVAARDYQVVPALFATQIYVQVVIRQLATLSWLAIQPSPRHLFGNT